MAQSSKHQGIDEITYRNPTIPPGIEIHEVPIVRATNTALNGYGCLAECAHHSLHKIGKADAEFFPISGSEQPQFRLSLAA
jgi:hypothetical protein